MYYLYIPLRKDDNIFSTNDDDLFNHTLNNLKEKFDLIFIIKSKEILSEKDVSNMFDVLEYYHKIDSTILQAVVEVKDNELILNIIKPVITDFSNLKNNPS